MRRALPSGVLLVGLALGIPACGASSEAIATDDADLWARNAAWSYDTDGIFRISVCWETPGFEADKEFVRKAVAESWEAVAAIQFLGWGDCGNGDLRLRIADERPHVPTFGTALRNQPGGITLNFTYAAWGSFCNTKRDVCNRAIAMHEFGHALGFLHEQDRPDAPLCPDGSDQRTGSIANNTSYLTAYDPDSIMNYCLSTYFTAPKLSAGDVAGVRQWYGTRGAPSPGVEGYRGPLRGLSGKCLDDAWGGTDDGNPIHLWACNGGDAQRWTYEGGTIRGPGGKCLDVPMNSDEDGTPVSLYTCNGTPAQRWTWHPDGTLRSSHGKCLDVANGNPAEGTPIQIWPCNGTVAQNWAPSW